MNDVRIVCGKFDRKIEFKTDKMKRNRLRIRIGSKNPRNFEFKEYIPIATDGIFVLYNNQKVELREFLYKTNKLILNKLIVLTERERLSILNELIDFGLTISVFEFKYPIFSHIKYIPDMISNYNELVKLIAKVRKMKIKGKGIAHYLSNKHLFYIERKLRFKTSLDRYFAFAYKGGYQEVFKMREEREERVVIAFDFNSMFASCMTGKFVEPKSIEYLDFRATNIDLNDLPNGLFRVIFKEPKQTFFRKFHPFKYCNLNSSYYFNIEENHEIEILLFRNEINYYKRFFNETLVLDGLCSDKEIEHPLIKEAKQKYLERLTYKSQKNTIMQDYTKFSLITMHSATNPKKFKNIFFKCKSDLIDYLANEFMFNLPVDMSYSDMLGLVQDHKYLSFKKVDYGYSARVIDFDSKESIYSLSSQVLANSRVKMMETIESFLQHKSVEICYSNIDSLHVSILKKDMDGFLSKHQDIISTKLGDLKIETIADKGYWFDIGRYWLTRNGKVELFKNKLFNHKGSKTIFSKTREVKVLRKGHDFSYIKSLYMNIENSFSYQKRIQEKKCIDYCDYTRYNFKEIENLNVAGETYNNEMLSSKRTKIELFNKIATV